MKTKLRDVGMEACLIAIVAMIVMLSCAGCMGGDRNLIGDNLVGADVKTARDSAGAMIEAETVQGNLKEISVLAKSIANAEVPEAVKVAAKGIDQRTKESSRLMTRILIKLKGIHLRSLGKTFRSKTRIFMIGLAGFAVLGIVLRFAFPGLWPSITRAAGAIVDEIRNTISGFNRDMRKANTAHLKRTSTIPNGELPMSIQDRIKEGEDEARLIGR